MVKNNNEFLKFSVCVDIYLNIHSDSGLEVIFSLRRLKKNTFTKKKKKKKTT